MEVVKRYLAAFPRKAGWVICELIIGILVGGLLAALWLRGM